MNIVLLSYDYRVLTAIKLLVTDLHYADGMTLVVYHSNRYVHAVSTYIIPKSVTVYCGTRRKYINCHWVIHRWRYYQQSENLSGRQVLVLRARS